MKIWSVLGDREVTSVIVKVKQLIDDKSVIDQFSVVT